jgi:hypothetical protein
MFTKVSLQAALAAIGMTVLAAGASAQTFFPHHNAPMLTTPGAGTVFQGQRWHGFQQPQRSAPTLIDQNGDGVVQPDEVAARFEQRFGAYDANGDGAVVKDEFMSVQMQMGANGRMPQYSKKEARFAGMDTNKNGKISKAEFLSAGEKRFKAADSDGDGKVSVWEYRSTRP